MFSTKTLSKFIRLRESESENARKTDIWVIAGGNVGLNLLWMNPSIIRRFNIVLEILLGMYKINEPEINRRKCVINRRKKCVILQFERNSPDLRKISQIFLFHRLVLVNEFPCDHPVFDKAFLLQNRLSRIFLLALAFRLAKN